MIESRETEKANTKVGDCMSEKSVAEENAKRKKKPKNKRVRRILRIVFASLAIVVAVGLFILADSLEMSDWHKLDMSLILDAKQSSIIYDKDDTEISILYSKEDRQWVSIDEIPVHTRDAFIAVEDARFYEHNGVDIIRIFGALIHDLMVGSFEQGASTLSQQLIKLSHLTPEQGVADKTIARKAEEAVLACQMEAQYNKEQILEMYLNYVYFGGGYYGIEAAARGYFGVHANELTISQSALLAGVVKAPSNYAPHIEYENSIERRNLVLRLMQEAGFIDTAQYAKAVSERVELVKSETRGKRDYYIDMAVEEACNILSITKEEFYTKGYRLYTGYDKELQEQCEKTFTKQELFPDTDSQAAIVIKDVDSGMICSVMGGRKYEVTYGFNRATDISRSPGSAIKPIIVYAPALEYFGYTAASMLLDEPTNFDDYSPRNSNGKYYGWVTLRDAVTKSLNVPAVKILSNIGVDTGKMFANKLGIEFDASDNGLALALGGFAYGVSPWQMTMAYSCFASGGILRENTTIRSITDRDGNVLYERAAKEIRVMSEQNAYILNNMLTDVIESGTGKRLRGLNVSLAGKTGTASDNAGIRDAWMCVYNPEYAATVWMGYDDGMQRLPSQTTGGNNPALVLKDIFTWIYKDRKAKEFVMPSGVEVCDIDAYTLKKTQVATLATVLTPKKHIIREVFLKGTEPTKTSTYWTVPGPPKDFSVVLYEGYPRITFTPTLSHIVYTVFREDSEGNAVAIGHWTNLTTGVIYYDLDVMDGEAYSYYVVPSHPGIQIDGQSAQGVYSNVVSVYVPVREEPPEYWDDYE